MPIPLPDAPVVWARRWQPDRAQALADALALRLKIPEFLEDGSPNPVLASAFATIDFAFSRYLDETGVDERNIRHERDKPPPDRYPGEAVVIDPRPGSPAPPR